jgi:uncharacterized protein DUF2190
MAIFKLVEGLTYAADAAVDLSNSLNRFCVINSDGEVALAGNEEKPIGTIFEAAAIGGPVSIQMGGICKVVVGAVAIAAGARVNSGANGVAETGTVNPVGIALNAAAPGAIVSVAMVG